MNQVAKLGRQVLSLAGLDLAPVAPIPGPRAGSAAAAAGSNNAASYPLSSSAGSTGAGSAQGGGSMAGSGGMGSSLGSLTQKFVKSSRSWRSGFTSTSSQRGGAAGGTGQGSSGSPPSPSRADGTVGGGSATAAAGYPVFMQAGFSRNPYILRSTGPPLQQQTAAGIMAPGMDPAAAAAAGVLGAASYAGMRQPGSDMGLGVNAAAGDVSGLTHAGSSASSLDPSRAGSMQYLAGEDVSMLPELPASHIVKMSYDAFSRPMIEPMVGVLRQPLFLFSHFPWSHRLH